jgi:hypothetical protein
MHNTIGRIVFDYAQNGAIGTRFCGKIVAGDGDVL